MNEFEEMLIALWKTMQGEMVTKSVFEVMSQKCDKAALAQFKSIYDEPKTNIMLLWPLAFYDMPLKDFWKEFQPEEELPEVISDFFGRQGPWVLQVWVNETVFETMITSQKMWSEELNKLCQSLYYNPECLDNKPKLMTSLLEHLQKVPYSLDVHLAFMVILLNLEYVTKENYTLLESAYERHKAGLEARGKKWKKGRQQG